jgi:hypothetical protein
VRVCVTFYPCFSASVLSFCACASLLCRLRLRIHVVSVNNIQHQNSLQFHLSPLPCLSPSLPLSLSPSPPLPLSQAPLIPSSACMPLCTIGHCQTATMLKPKTSLMKTKPKTLDFPQTIDHKAETLNRESFYSGRGRAGRRQPRSPTLSCRRSSQTSRDGISRSPAS